MRFAGPASILAVGVLVLSCTFGLGDAPVEGCTPAGTQAEDVCDRLDPDPASCQPWQCDAVTRRCVRRPRDDDHDGDPSVLCGGKDCNDHDVTVSSRRTETCDGVDNDCDGLVDEDRYAADLPISVGSDTGGPLSPENEGHIGSGTSTADAVAAFRKTRSDAFGCIGVITPGASGERCGLGEPREPFAMKLGTDFGFVYTDARDPSPTCLRYASTLGGSAVAKAACLRHPVVATVDGATAFVVGYEGRNIGACDEATRLLAMPVDGPSSLAPALGEPIELASPARAASTPAFVVAQGAATPRLLLAAAVDEAVGLWRVDGRTVGSVARVALPGARGVAMAITGTTVAIAVQTGCGSTLLSVWLGELSPGLDAMATPFHAVLSGIAGALPSIAWSAGSKEWRLAWLASGRTARGLRLTRDGRPVGEPFFVTADVLAGALAGPDTYVALRTKSLDTIGLRCR